MGKRGKRNKSATATKVELNISLSMLDNLIQFVFTKNKKINRKSLSQINDAIFIYSELDKYLESPDLAARLHLLNHSIKFKNKYDIHQTDKVIEHCATGKYKNKILEDLYPDLKNKLKKKPLDEKEIKYINEWSTQRLKYALVFLHGEKNYQLYEKIKHEEYTDLESMLAEYQASNQKVAQSLRKIESEKEESYAFDFSEESFLNASNNILTELAKPSRFLRTGIQCLNQLMGNGLEARRVYVVIGHYGGFKSNLLLSIAKWVRDYNTDYVPKKEGVRPCVLYITQENSEIETYERLFKMTFGQYDLKELSSKKIFNMYKGKGYFDPSSINIRILYRASKSINVGDIYDIIDDVEEQGEEVILVVQDYIKRIKSTSYYPNKERWVEFADVVDDFNILAKTKEIPVLTAMQMNREAIKIMENINSLSDENKIKKEQQKIGGTSISESLAILENVDWACLIQKFTDRLWFKRIKKRYECGLMEVFTHPFDAKNNLALIEDIGKESASRPDLNDQNEILNNIENTEKFGNGNPRKKKGKDELKGIYSSRPMMFDEDDD